jgi:hypothetical protein
MQSPHTGLFNVVILHKVQGLFSGHTKVSYHTRSISTRLCNVQWPHRDSNRGSRNNPLALQFLLLQPYGALLGVLTTPVLYHLAMSGDEANSGGGGGS